ncbi:MAG: hypothetical protein IJV06_11735 [Bacteroidaceae bacterium]|nr:hypothetical protein [Bacteroidaceae bacterium]
MDFDFIFRSSNNLSHDKGYILTYKVNNPKDWDVWYTQFASDTHDKLSTVAYNKEDGYNAGPTYYINDGSKRLLGQTDYIEGNIISKEVYDTYNEAVGLHPEAIAGRTDQASFTEAYIVTQQVTVPATETKPEAHYYAGSTVSKADATTIGAFAGKVEPAYVCTHTIQLSATEYIYLDAKMSKTEAEAYYNRFKDSNPELAAEIRANIVPAYYCTGAGLYGGNYYEPGRNYRGLEAWCSMSEDDRKHFSFNYDALNVLIDPLYSRNAAGQVVHAEGQKYQYDSALGTLAGAQANPAGYSLEKPVNYTASYNGESLTLSKNITFKRKGVTTTTNTIQKNDELDREAFESIPNERRHYATIDVKDNLTVYVVEKSFQVGNTPYAVGTTITEKEYTSLGDLDKENIATLSFAEGDKNKKFYFCREEYKIGENGEGRGITDLTKHPYSDGQTVPVGVVIDATNYGDLVNKQTDFIIHGIAPTETSTLYVSRYSDIFDLSTEKIITVIYQYDYEESDASGNITPVSERHVVNIHIDFKSGVPTMEDIKKPQVILPGTKLGLREPTVTPGAYEVTGGGWELFENIDDAESHQNGIEYLPNIDPLYWYQHGYYVAYYAKTYLGKTYSNHEPISVANYHDLTKVMNDTEHHYYVDNPNVKRNSKIYLTDWQNGITQLKDFFNLSLLNSSSAGVTDGVVTAEGNLEGHALLDEYVKDCENLEFIMHTDVTMPEGTWTPIASNTGECFSGNLHGDGYTISGLTGSLFQHLCGNVYNLGVTGSFTGAGIAEEGKGYMENCWISTSSTAEKTSKPLFGNPSRGSGYQLVNCYYLENDDATGKYTNHSGTYGIPTRMSEQAFYNGTVAYDLNGFYLYKRYNDGQGTASGTKYSYYTATDGTLALHTNGYYASNPSYCSTGSGQTYVEDRYADGDFRYADGSIPETDDVRTDTDAEGATHFYPIYPDDYLYFGQKLTYGWNDQQPHEELPAHIYKSSGRLVANAQSNRVYRAPAYYRSKAMGVAHFNPAVNLVAHSKPKNQYDTALKAAYPYMTAIDFKGHNDTAYKLGFNGNKFYQPLLDDDGLVSITNRDETPNLLVYAPSQTQNGKTYTVLNDYFVEPVYNSYEAHDGYGSVAKASTSSVFGHLVQSDLIATGDHLLVDKQDFNCPIEYSFDNDHRVWYQRTPDRYVSQDKGWDAVSIPFRAELVTTNQKGEITHFYSGSAESSNGTHTKIGHEYWLREYKDISAVDAELKAEALFQYPTATGSTKTVNNTFLWDYYYQAASGHSHQDANDDTYQTYYNNSSRVYEDYPRIANGTPYLLGFPGQTYYEFDLSGNFVATTTANPNPARLLQQTITFVSEEGSTISCSDDELASSKVSYNGYTFTPNYMATAIPAAEAYTMQTDGGSYKLTSAATTAVPFRPYFVGASSSGAKSRAGTITFSSAESSLLYKDGPDLADLTQGYLDIKARNRSIIVKSHYEKTTTVTIVNAAGALINTFQLEPGSTVETRVSAGVYIVNQTKVTVK